ncbi:MAG: hypothetical protein HY889_01400 [Deltaproteobacteria bacterium]|nr:hypothetical protein [Deltaproteobacteria bacterium]
MCLKTLLILFFLLLVIDAEVSRRFIVSDAVYLLGVHRSSVTRERVRKEEAMKAAQGISEVSALSSQIAQSHAELREEYKQAAKTLSAKDALGKDAAAPKGDDHLSKIESIKDLLTLESEAFKKALERLGEFHEGKVPERQRRVVDDLPNMSKEQRVRSSEEHLKKGIAYFQAEDLETAIKVWDAAIELDRDNKTAVEYKRRAEVVLERLKEIRAQEKPVKPEERPTPAPPPS